MSRWRVGAADPTARAGGESRCGRRFAQRFPTAALLVMGGSSGAPGPGYGRGSWGHPHGLREEQWKWPGRLLPTLTWHPEGLMQPWPGPAPQGPRSTIHGASSAGCARLVLAPLSPQRPPGWAGGGKRNWQNPAAQTLLHASLWSVFLSRRNLW